MDSQKILDAITALESKMADLAKGDARIPEIEKKLAALQEDFRAAQQAAAEKPDEKAETFGQAFVKSAGFAAYQSGSARSFRFEKDINPTVAPTVTHHVDGIKGANPEYVVEDFIAATPVAGNLIEYVKESSWTNSAAAVLEAGTKPLSGIEFTTAQMPVQTIAHILRVTKQLVADAPALAAYIDQRMAMGVAKKAEDEIVAGSGTSPHLSGLMTTGNYTAHGLTQGTGETNLDLIRKCAMAIRIAGFRPNAVLMNPADYDALLGLKNTSGEYLISNPVAESAPKLWGLSVIQSSAVTAGDFLVGDFSMANIWNRQGITVEMFEQDADNVSKNLVTIRAERRMALTVESALAFVGGALWS